MFGYILHYSVQTGEGVISGDDGARYNFAGRDWLGHEPPSRGDRVEFAVLDGRDPGRHQVVASPFDEPRLLSGAAWCGAVAGGVTATQQFPSLGIRQFPGSTKPIPNLGLQFLCLRVE